MTAESPIDLVERLGPAAERDPVVRRQAAQKLVELMEGGVMRLGAEQMLANYRNLRAELEGIRRDAAAGLDQIYGL